MLHGLLKKNALFMFSHDQLRLTCLLGAFLFGAFGVSSLFSLTILNASFAERAQFQAEALTRGRVWDMALTALDAHGHDAAELTQALRTALTDASNDALAQLAVIAADGRLVAHHERSLRDQPLSPQRIRQLLTAQTPQVFAERGVYHVVFPMRDQRGVALGLFDVGLSNRSERRRMTAFFAGQTLLFLGTASLAAFAVFRLSRRSVRAVHEMLRVSERVLTGDLTSDMPVLTGRGDIMRLAQRFYQVVTSLRGLTQQVRQATDKIAAVAEDLLRATDRLAAALEEQSSALTETSINMESVAQASQQISSNTDAVVQIAEKTRADAQKGTEIANDALRKMQDIQASNQTDTAHIQQLGQTSTEIFKIMDVIASIADQTKLIAFNALLEAADVGEKGRRFGVVAKEIRVLADHVIHSTNAIRKSVDDIQTAIKNLQQSSETSTENIRQGADCTIRTTNWLQEIVSGATQTTRIAQKIARSILKQQLASEEISSALKELVDNTGDFMDTSSQARDIAAQLNALTGELDALIGELKA